MSGISPEILNQIRELLDDYFDDITLALLGLSYDEASGDLIFGNSEVSLASLYMKALNSTPNEQEEDVLKGILSVTNDYTEALKAKTIADVTSDLNNYANGQSLKKEPIEKEVVEILVEKQMETAENKFKVIASAQSNVTKNMGLISAFTRMSEENGQEETYVFWRPVPPDDRTSQATFDVHLMPDRITPKVWKTSEINMGFFKKGDMRPSIFNTSPNCRCAMSLISLGFGFDAAGKTVYKGKGWNEYENQRK